MRTLTARRATRLFYIDVAAVIIALVAFAGVASAQETSSSTTTDVTATSPVTSAINTTRRSFSVEGYKGRALGPVQPKSRTLPQTKQRLDVARNADSGFYVFDGFAEVYFDDDGDGFFYGLDVFFDVDTDFVTANVYAALYLSLNGGPWELYYTTDDFRVDGAVADDEYVVETELFEGYPTDFYDVLVEIYDADFGDFVAEYGPADNSALSVLPLEDQLKDTPIATGGGFVVVDNGGGGAMGLALAGLGLLMLGRRRK